MSNFMTFGIADAFQYPIAAFIAALGLMIILFQVAISKTPLGRDRNKGVGIMISFILALIAAYGIFVREESYYQLPTWGLPFGFDFLYDLGLPNLGAFLSSLGILGIPIILMFLGILFILARAFIRFLRTNWGV